jgi:hypothetical protein
VQNLKALKLALDVTRKVCYNAAAQQATKVPKKRSAVVVIVVVAVSVLLHAYMRTQADFSC